MRPAVCQSGRIGESGSGITSRVRMGGSIPASHCRLVNKQQLPREAQSRRFTRTSVFDASAAPAGRAAAVNAFASLIRE